MGTTSGKTGDAKSGGGQQKIGVRYDDLMARYASQVLLRTTPEEVFLEFSSGPIPDPSSGQPLMPIHTRIAMSHSAARRLAEILAQTVLRPQGGTVETQTGAGDTASGFPPLKK